MTDLRMRDVDGLIARALREDMPRGDVTTESLVPPKALARALLAAKQPGILAGLEVAIRVFQTLDPRVSVNRFLADGAAFGAGDILAEIEGRAVTILEGERTALNILQRLCGIATMARKYVDAVAGTGAIVLDTRKTTPGLRALEKYAVRMGGASNHRPDLSSMALIKDNHLMMEPDIVRAVRRIRRKAGRKMPVEVEVTSFAQARRAVTAGADWIMLDNMAPGEMRRIVRWIGGRAKVEASGNIDLGTIGKVARTGVDFISVGKLTHSVGAVDISLEFLGPLGRSVDRVAPKIGRNP
jgi:nicotinate-nucleotide pyrophosphorylase (carboxylating)